MAGIDILDLVEATEVNETNDYLAIVDTSDTTQDTSGSTKKITVGNFLSGMLDWFYPVGTIYETTSSDLDTVEKVNAHFGGTWEFYGAGRVLVAKSADTEFDTIGKTGGEKTHTLTIAEMPSHTHIQNSHTHTQDSHNHTIKGSISAGNYAEGVAFGNDQTPDFTSSVGMSSVAPTINSSTATNQNTGGGGAHNNLPPYQVVYRYRRIS